MKKTLITKEELKKEVALIGKEYLKKEIALIAKEIAGLEKNTAYLKKQKEKLVKIINSII